MSKAEDRALKAYPPKFTEQKRYSKRVRSEKTDVHQPVRAIYTKGYHQAEKDLALTWNDIMVIHKCIKDAINFHLYEWFTEEGQQRIYQNVLDRFNKLRKRD